MQAPLVEARVQLSCARSHDNAASALGVDSSLQVCSLARARGPGVQQALLQWYRSSTTLRAGRRAELLGSKRLTTRADPPHQLTNPLPPPHPHTRVLALVSTGTGDQPRATGGGGRGEGRLGRARTCSHEPIACVRAFVQTRSRGVFVQGVRNRAEPRGNTVSHRRTGPSPSRLHSRRPAAAAAAAAAAASSATASGRRPSGPSRLRSARCRGTPFCRGQPGLDWNASLETRGGKVD